MKLPNFFIVGAAKSGTTSLYHYLRQHPQVFMPEIKEPSYFMDWEGGIRSFDDYTSLFSDANDETAIGEASTGYLYEPEAPSRIRERFPQARIVVVLRNPVEMCFALWRHMRRLGKRGERLSFETALAEESARMSNPRFRSACVQSWHANFYYFNRASYYSQIRRYLDIFGSERLLVLLFESFKENPTETCRTVFRFLEVEDEFNPDMTKHNVGVEVRHRGLQKALDDPHPVFKRMSALLQLKTARRMKDWLRRINIRPAPTMNAQTRLMLAESFSSDVELLGRLLDKDLTPWLRGI